MEEITMMKKTVAILLSILMLLALAAGCTAAAPAAEATEAPAEATATAEPTAAPEEAKTYSIGIVQIVEHAALDAATAALAQEAE